MHQKSKHSTRIPRRYLIAGLLVLVTSLLFSPPSLELQTAKSETNERVTPVKSQNELTIKLAQRVANRDEFGVAVKDLQSGEEYNLGDENTFDAASTTKLLIVSLMYKQAANNQFDLDEVITIDSKDVQRYGTGSIQYDNAPYKYSYRELARRMIKQSDNTAAYVLAQKLGTEKLQSFAKEIGLEHTNLEQNTTTAHDMIELLQKMYDGKLTSSELNGEMMNLTRDTQFEQRIPGHLPPGTVVYHKTGDAFNGGAHDVGIVEAGDKKYAVSIFSIGLSDEEIAEMSRDIYSYVTR